jgi:hypothetical protein
MGILRACVLGSRTGSSLRLLGIPDFCVDYVRTRSLGASEVPMNLKIPGRVHLCSWWDSNELVDYFRGKAVMLCAVMFGNGSSEQPR